MAEEQDTIREERILMEDLAEIVFEASTSPPPVRVDMKGT